VLDGLPAVPSAPDEGVLHGRIVMAGAVDDLERAFDASKYGRVSEAPYLEATVPSLADPSLAPDGRHVMSVVVQFAPYRLAEGDWDREREALGDRVLERLEVFAPGVSGRVVHRQVLTPLDLERDFGLTGGHPLHGEPGLDQFFAWRPMWGYARYRMPVDGMYLCGSGAHPGGGVTGGPGANSAREVLADLKRSRS
jgi:phytoene dehydrogenase-like protein